MGTDGSETATRAVDRAVELARTSDASLTVLSVGKLGPRVVAAEAERLADSGVAIDTRAVEGDAVQGRSRWRPTAASTSSWWATRG